MSSDKAIDGCHSRQNEMKKVASKRKSNVLADFWCGSALDDYENSILRNASHQSFERPTRVLSEPPQSSPSADSNIRRQGPQLLAGKEASTQASREQQQQQQQQQGAQLLANKEAVTQASREEQQQQQQLQRQQNEKQPEQQEEGEQGQRHGRALLVPAESPVTTRLTKNAPPPQLTTASMFGGDVSVDATRCLSNQTEDIFHTVELQPEPATELKRKRDDARRHLVVTQALGKPAGQRILIDALQKEPNETSANLRESVTCSTGLGGGGLADRNLAAIRTAEELLSLTLGGAALKRQTLIDRYESVQARLPDVLRYIESTVCRGKLPKMPKDLTELLSSLVSDDVRAVGEAGRVMLGEMARAAALAVESGQEAAKKRRAKVSVPDGFPAAVLAAQHEKAIVQATIVTATRRAIVAQGKSDTHMPLQ